MILFAVYSLEWPSLGDCRCCKSNFDCSIASQRNGLLYIFYYFLYISFVVFLFDYFCLHGRTNGSSKRNMVESRNIRTLQWLFGESKSLCVKYRGDTRKLDLASASLSFSVAPFARVSFARAQNAPSRIASETYHLSG